VTVTCAVFDGAVIAESDGVRLVEGMSYFPIGSVDVDRLVASPTTSPCFWKGKATYFHVRGQLRVATDAAFTYRRP